MSRGGGRREAAALIIVEVSVGLFLDFVSSAQHEEKKSSKKKENTTLRVPKSSLTSVLTKPVAA